MNASCRLEAQQAIGGNRFRASAASYNAPPGQGREPMRALSHSRRTALGSHCALGWLEIDRMCQHLALFYADDYPAEEVGDFFAAGLAAGDHCLALLTAPHRRAVAQCLEARGLGAAHAAYAAVDTDEVLAQCLVDGRLDLQRASALLTPLMTVPARSGLRRVRAAGDLAPALVAAGKINDAVAFEALVHRLTLAHDATVICAYPIGAIWGRDNMRALLRLSAEHASVEFPEQLWIRALTQAPLHRVA